MDHSSQSTIPLPLVKEIDYLVSRMLDVCGDPTEVSEMYVIAQYMLHTLNYKLDHAIELVHRPGARSLFRKIFDNQSSFYNSEGRAVGIDCVAHMTANKLQQSLDVKHIQKKQAIVTSSVNITATNADGSRRSQFCRIYQPLENEANNDGSSATTRGMTLNHTPRTSGSGRNTLTATATTSSTFLSTFNLRTVIDRIIPTLKIDLLYSNPNVVWIRFHTLEQNFKLPAYTTVISERGNVQNKYGKYLVSSTLMSTGVTTAVINYDFVLLPICENVYEVYVENNANTIKQVVSELINYIDKIGNVIFCSELKLFQYNQLLFLSNYLKFSYCYSMPRDIFDPVEFYEIRVTTMYIFYGILFLNTNNLTNMPARTHGPLIAYNGERPKAALSKFDSSHIYVNEGTRAMLAMDKASDIGSRSNYVEVVINVKLTDDLLDCIM